MLSKFAPIFLASAALMLAADAPTASKRAQPIQISHTDRFDLPAGGTMRLPHSFGELNIEGWDRQQVEITVIKMATDVDAAEDRAKVTARLESVHVTGELKGKDVVVTTGSSEHGFPPGPWAMPGIDLEYDIKVPMNAALNIYHGWGDVNISNVLGDIQARVGSGGITLDLSPESKYTVKALSDFGEVISDFPGRKHRKLWCIGRDFNGKIGDGSHKLDLTARYGDIILIKAWEPPADATR